MQDPILWLNRTVIIKGFKLLNHIFMKKIIHDSGQ